MKKLNRDDIIEKIIELEEMLDEEEENEEFRMQCRKVANMIKIVEEELGIEFTSEDIIKLCIKGGNC